MPTKITVTIEDELGDLSVAANGWKKQLTYTSWNGRDPKFDLRSWSVDHKSRSDVDKRGNDQTQRNFKWN